MPKHWSKDEVLLAVTGGRSIDEQLDFIRREKNHASPNILRGKLFQALGIDQPKPKAENVVLTGCYAPYGEPLTVRNYLVLLKHLGIDFTYLKDEICCGLVPYETSEGEERLRAEEAVKEFMGSNLEQVKKAGAKNAVYLCVWCAYLAKKYFSDSPINQMHYPDILLDRLAGEKLRVEPKAVGYYEGCHRRNKKFAPGVDLDWDRYREALNKIEGLKVVKMPDNLCCVDIPDRIVSAAQDLNLNTIVCSCRACFVRLRVVNKGKVRIQYYPDLLLEALSTEYISGCTPGQGY